MTRKEASEKICPLINNLCKVEKCMVWKDTKRRSNVISICSTPLNGSQGFLDYFKNQKSQLETYQAEIQKAFLIKEGMLNVLCAGSTAYRSKMFEQAKYITSNKLNIETKKEKL